MEYLYIDNFLDEQHGDKSNIERFFVAIEEYRITEMSNSGVIPDKELLILENNLVKLENAMQDYLYIISQHHDRLTLLDLYVFVNHTLFVWLILFRRASDKTKVIPELSDKVDVMTNLILANLTMSDDRQIQQIVETAKINFIPSLMLIDKAGIDYSQGQDLRRSILHHNHRRVSGDRIDPKSLIDMSYEWECSVSTMSNTASKITFMIWALSSALESIDGVEVELTDWGRGSFWAKLKIIMAGWVSKEEVKSVIVKTANGLMDQHITKHTEEVNKVKKEIEVLNAQLERQLSINDSNELAKLEIALKKEQLRKERLENIKTASELIKEGVIKMDSDFQISINDIFFIGKKNGELSANENIGDELAS